VPTRRRSRAKERRAVLQRGHDLHLDHPRLAIEHVPDPDLAIDVHPRRQAVAAVGGMLQRDGVNQKFEDKPTARISTEYQPMLSSLQHGVLKR
jgi:hypothetical protein